MLYRAMALALLVACAGPGGSEPIGATPDARNTLDANPQGDGATADTSLQADASVADPGDGTPMRRPCVEQLGSGLTTSYGRLDGVLVAIVPPGSNKCHGDADHVHLQILANNMTYDVAVNVGVQAQDVHTTTRELAFPAWSEGWHPGAHEDYATLGVHTADIPLQTSSQIISALDADLATANHITIFATGYGSNGAHLVHENGGGHDGMVVTHPLSSPAHARLFSFSGQSF